MAAKVMLLLFAAGWIAPAALASYTSGAHACCRRGAHHCPTAGEQAFRDAQLHCHHCQLLLPAHQAPQVAPASLVIGSRDEHPYVHEFSSAFSPARTVGSRSQRAPPSER